MADSVFRRLALALGGNDWVHHEMRFLVGPPVLQLTPAEVRKPASSGFAELVRLLATIPYPHFSVRRHLDSKRVVGLGGSGVVDEVLRIMTAFQPLVVFLNEDAAVVQRLEAELRSLQAQIDALLGKDGTLGDRQKIAVD